MPADIGKYKNPAATASLIVPSWYGNVISPRVAIYLVKRKHEPFKGMWALPGGFLNCDEESLEETAVRELQEETNLEAKIKDLKLFCVNSSPIRDPRGHVIDHVYIVNKYSGTPKEGDDAARLKIFPINNLPPLAFDHAEVLKKYWLWRNRYGN